MPLTRELRQSEPIRTDGNLPVPSIDFRKLPEPGDEIQRMREACLKTGFFYLDHAFENDQLVTNALRQMENFFALDDAGKEAVRVTATNKYGWTKFAGQWHKMS